MRDEHHSDALCLERGDHLEQLLGFRDRQARGRLVEDHEPRIQAERLGDLDDLPLRERKPGHRGRRGKIRSELVEIRLHYRVQFLVVNDVEQAKFSGLSPDEHVGRDVEVIEQIQLLMDEGDAGVHRVGDRKALVRNAVDLDRATVGRRDAA